MREQCSKHFINFVRSNRFSDLTNIKEMKKKTIYKKVTMDFKIRIFTVK